MHIGNNTEILKYYRYRCDLILNGKIVNTTYGKIDINYFDGVLWIGKNGRASKPNYFNRIIKSFSIQY